MKLSSSPAVLDDLIEIGKITGAHGIRGAVKVLSYAESPERFAPPVEVFLVDPEGRRIRRRVVWSQAHRQTVRLLLAGIATRDEAVALTGWRILIEKKNLPPLAPDTYYWCDVIGMAVHTVEGEYLGKVVQIIPTGANDVYVVQTPAGHKVDEILVPAIASVVMDFDVPGRCMRVALPEGLV